MPANSYERYGLTGNPFRDLASESLDDVEIFHVNLQIDDALRTIKEEVLEKENRTIVGLIGPLGTGKTERLRLALLEGRQRGATTIYLDVPKTTLQLVQTIATAITASAAPKLGGLARTFSPPSWFRDIQSLEKIAPAKFNPGTAGKIVGTALTHVAPTFLLLNDLHNVASKNEAALLAPFLHEVNDSIRAGVLVEFGSYPGYWTAVCQAYPALASRINRTFLLPGLASDEAVLLLAKKLLAKRLVEDLDPIYPFDKEAVAALNDAAGGNPRRLLELADLTIEYAVEHRAYRVDADLVKAAFEARRAATAAAAPSAVPARRPPTPARAPATPGGGVAPAVPRPGGPVTSGTVEPR